MTLTLEQEHREFEEKSWYRILADDSYITGSYDLKEIEAEFQKLKANPNLLKSHIKILRSEEISLPL